MSDYMNYQEAATFLGLKVGTVYSLVCRKRVPHVRLSSRLVRFSREALREWMDSQRVAPNATAKRGR